MIVLWNHGNALHFKIRISHVQLHPTFFFSSSSLVVEFTHLNCRGVENLRFELWSLQIMFLIVIN
jgi:hypothetical protein